jgi:hypothetical protein
MWGTKKGKMLKITITDTATEGKWTLQGRLVWPWVNELRVNWAKAQRAAEGRTCIADVNEVRFIEESGERILRTMSTKARNVSPGERHVVYPAGGFAGDRPGGVWGT